MASRKVVAIERDRCVAAPAPLRLRACGIACDCSPVASLFAVEPKACLTTRQVEIGGGLKKTALPRQATGTVRPIVARRVNPAVTFDFQQAPGPKPALIKRTNESDKKILTYI